MQASLASHDKIILTQGFIARTAKGDTSCSGVVDRTRRLRTLLHACRPGGLKFGLTSRVCLLRTHASCRRRDCSLLCATTKRRNWHPPAAPCCIRDASLRCAVWNSAVHTQHRTPEIGGTVISSVTEEIEPQVKGICIRNGLTLISMDGVGMWHEVGFLAKAFAAFSANGVSVDLISTSETNVTVSIDNCRRNAVG